MRFAGSKSTENRCAPARGAWCALFPRRHRSDLLRRTLLVLLCSFPAAATAQTQTPEAVTAAYLIQFIDNIYWPGEADRAQFRLGIFDDDSTMIGAVRRSSEQKLIRGKAIVVVPLHSLRDVRAVDLVYLNEERSIDISGVANAVRGAPIAFVSCDGAPHELTMLDLQYSAETHTMPYTINRAAFERQGLSVTSELLLLGGTRSEAHELFRQSEDTVRIERERIAEQLRQLGEQERTLNGQRQEISNQRQVIGTQDDYIRRQRVQLDSLAAALLDMGGLVRVNTAVLSRQRRDMQTQQDTIARQQAQVEDQNQTLEDQQLEIEDRQREISSQDTTLRRQMSTITQQRQTLTVTITILLFVALLAIVLWRSYRIIRRINIEIEHKSEQIARQRDELERQAVLLRAANEELESFSYSVSHDLRAPLRGIHGFSEALAEEYGRALDVQGMDYLRRVQASTQKMSNLIDDLLKLSRLGRLALQRVSVDLTPIVRAIVAELRHGDPHRAVEVIIPEHLPADADPRLITIVLQNLLGNAWKFTGKTALARIEMGLRHEDGRDAYFVKDNGAGFSTQYRNRLFAPFQRLHGDEEFAGTGIGLSMVQRIIHRHGGTISADGAPGEGATFTFTLPPILESTRGEEERTAG